MSFESFTVILGLNNIIEPWHEISSTGVYLSAFLCSGIQFYVHVLLSPYLCFISFLYLDLYVLGGGWVRGLSCKPYIYVFWYTSELWVRLAVRETGISPPLKYFTGCSKAVLLLWIVCVIYVMRLSCFRVCSLLPCDHLKGKGWPLGSCFVIFIVILILSTLVTRDKCGTWWYQFLILAVFVLPTMLHVLWSVCAYARC